MPYLFGSHVSCQGGLLCGIDRAVEAGCDCLQVFVCQPRQWPSIKGCIPLEQVKASKSKASKSKASKSKAPVDDCATEAQAAEPTIELSSAELTRFEEALAKHKFPPPVAHASYLINLGSSAAEQWNKSLEALEIEWRRADALKLAGLVMHPGAHLEATPEAGLTNIVRGIEAVLERVRPKHCKLLLENTAGQGSCLGWRFEELGWLTKRLNRPESIGVCFDTCHAYAAGYDYSTPAKLKAMWAEFDQHVGLETLQAIHMNDSQKGLGSRVDRHEHIGRGAIGEKALTLFIKSEPVKRLPMFLETEKGINPETGIDYDQENLATLRRMVGR